MREGLKSRRKKRAAKRKGYCVLAAIYLLIGLRYRGAFLPNTTIGTIPVSGMTVAEVKDEITARIGGYQLILEERGGKEEVIYGKDIDLHPIYDGMLEEILKEQNFLLWGVHQIRGEEYQQNYMMDFDREKLEYVVSGLECLKPDRIAEPSDAHLAYTVESGLQIIQEELGDSPVEERLFEEIAKAVASLTGRISLEELDIYEKPGVLKDNPGLIAQMESWKPYTDTTITYRFGSRSETLDGNTILQWLSDDGDGNAIIDQTMVEEYIKKLAEKYNTAYCVKEFKTSYGPTVAIAKGHYGWMIDKQKEISALAQLISTGVSQEREPVYLQTAASHDGPDYGDTYVEINLTAQHLYFYKAGKLLIESDFVSGDKAKGYSTPDGAYELTYKQRNAVLRGKNYNTPVTYWMPFNGNIGMHDGYWRSSFGGTIYKNNGSHGCINLPPAVAKIIYDNIQSGIPVLCYHLEGTESKRKTTISSGKKKAAPTTGSTSETPASSEVPALPEASASSDTPEGLEPSASQGSPVTPEPSASQELPVTPEPSASQGSPVTPELPVSPKPPAVSPPSAFPPSTAESPAACEPPIEGESHAD